MNAGNTSLPLQQRGGPLRSQFSPNCFYSRLAHPSKLKATCMMSAKHRMALPCPAQGHPASCTVPAPQHYSHLRRPLRRPQLGLRELGLQQVHNHPLREGERDKEQHIVAHNRAQLSSAQLLGLTGHSQPLQSPLAAACNSSSGSQHAGLRTRVHNPLAGLQVLHHRHGALGVHLQRQSHQRGCFQCPSSNRQVHSTAPRALAHRQAVSAAQTVAHSKIDPLHPPIVNRLQEPCTLPQQV